jgi:hypothetical protein
LSSIPRYISKEFLLFSTTQLVVPKTHFALSIPSSMPSSCG